MRKSRNILMVSLLVFPITAAGQTRPTGSGQKTIEISATEKVQVIAEVATIKIGYQNKAATKDAAYDENVRAANKILQALLDGGVPQEAIETEALSLEQYQDRFGEKAQKPSTYSASQKWSIRSKAAEAQKIVDIAVAAGANEIENVEWLVADPKQLETKAYAAAIKRARELAEQTASQTGLKLGEIISIVNSKSSVDRLSRLDFATSSASMVAIVPNFIPSKGVLGAVVVELREG